MPADDAPDLGQPQPVIDGMESGVSPIGAPRLAAFGGTIPFVFGPGPVSPFLLPDRSVANPLGIPADTAMPDVSAVPEPGSWALWISGFGLVGTVLRRTRGPSPGRPGRGGGVALRLRWTGIVGGMFGPSIGGAQLGVASAGQVLLTKAALCVCPAAMMVMAATTVPPLRNLLHAATMPAISAGTLPACVSTATNETALKHL